MVVPISNRLTAALYFIEWILPRFFFLLSLDYRFTLVAFFNIYSVFGNRDLFAWKCVQFQVWQLMNWIYSQMNKITFRFVSLRHYSSLNIWRSMRQDEQIIDLHQLYSNSFTKHICNLLIEFVFKINIFIFVQCNSSLDRKAISEKHNHYHFWCA